MTQKQFVAHLLYVSSVCVFLQGCYQSDKLPHKLSQNEHRSVLDCSEGDNCVVRMLEYNIKDCKPYTTDCTTTTEGLDRITYVADPANYVPVPFTSEKLTVVAVKRDLDKPWDIEFLPDGSLLITEMDGIERDG